ncbi:hypothetical protein BJ170DRAFT_629685 [Xylariales sp. AK1849]|nr:hypothetical protein BJ170DRAFT_629685 [Xylariales sp. AK1849]
MLTVLAYSSSLLAVLVLAKEIFQTGPGGEAKRDTDVLLKGNSGIWKREDEKRDTDVLLKGNSGIWKREDEKRAEDVLLKGNSGIWKRDER